MAKETLLLLSVFCLLLAGCTGVPQEKYDSLKNSCDSEKAVLQQSVSDQQARANGDENKLSECESARKTQENLLLSQESRIDALKIDADKLASAREKTNAAAQYQLALAYFNDAYGQGKIANTAKINRIDAQVKSLSDATLLSKWNSVRNYNTISDFDNAKIAFVSYANSKIGALNDEAVKMIASN